MHIWLVSLVLCSLEMKLHLSNTCGIIPQFFSNGGFPTLKVFVDFGFKRWYLCVYSEAWFTQSQFDSKLLTWHFHTRVCKVLEFFQSMLYELWQAYPIRSIAPSKVEGGGAYSSFKFSCMHLCFIQCHLFLSWPIIPVTDQCPSSPYPLSQIIQ